MTTHQNSSTSDNPRGRKGLKLPEKGGDPRSKLLLNNGNINPVFSTQAFEIPTVSTNGMKNIEHFIDKTLIEGKQWYRCKWQSCSYTTIRSDSIVRHMRKHTGERPYKCWFCSYATIQSSALKIHMRRHTGEKPYVCKFTNCGKRFAVLNTLVVHERTHTGYKPYKCTFSSCNYSSSDRCKLVNHLRKTHQFDVSKLTNVSDRQLSSLPLFTSVASSVSSSSQPSSSTSHSLALVSGAMSSSSQLLMANSMYNPFATSNSAPMTNSSLSNSNQLKNVPGSIVPLNLLSVISGNYDNSQNNSNMSAFEPASGRKSSKRKSASVSTNGHQNSAHHVVQSANHCHSSSHDGQWSPSNSSSAAVDREENSIKRVMILVDKRVTVDNRTEYLCKWPQCGYESVRSDSIVRHIRSHTGERPYKCNVTNCNYATIQRYTLNKHLERHQTAEYVSTRVLDM